MRLLPHALALALCLTATDAHARRTPLTRAQVTAALVAGHRDVFGKAPSAVRLFVARAHVGLEVGHGRWAYCNNLGNIGARRGGCRTKGGFRVAAYSSPRAAAFLDGDIPLAAGGAGPSRRRALEARQLQEVDERPSRRRALEARAFQA